MLRGLRWIARQQISDGHWPLDGDYPDPGAKNDIAGTAFGLLPLLGAGYTAKNSDDNPFSLNVERGLDYLIRAQDKTTGDFGAGMYAHALATLALCEGYGVTKDANLRRPAQLAVNHIVRAQHVHGGWRYSPSQAGDLSVTGFQVMALKSATAAALDVPAITMHKAQLFLDSVCASDLEGYAYVPYSEPSATMTSVGLFCRQQVQSWGPRNARMLYGVDNWIKRNPPGATKNMYYHLFATQVMRDFGGDAWKDWNAKMRDYLIATQDKTDRSSAGSWDSHGEHHTAGRLMQTSLCVLTLEVYYRYVPLGMTDR